MSNFDWPKVTTGQLRDVPQAVVGDGFKLVNHNEFLSLHHNGISAAELWLSEWKLTMQLSETAKVTIACIDRIENYLRMQGAT